LASFTDHVTLKNSVLQLLRDTSVAGSTAAPGSLSDRCGVMDTRSRDSGLGYADPASAGLHFCLWSVKGADSGEAPGLAVLQLVVP